MLTIFFSLKSLKVIWKKIIKTQKAIKITWNTRRGYLLRLIKSDSFQQKKITFRHLSEKMSTFVKFL